METPLLVWVLIDRVKVLRLTQHKTDHFGDVLLANLLK